MSKNIMKNAKILRIFLFLLIFTAAMMISPLGIMHVSADEIMTTTPVANLPQRVAVNETTNKIYVCSGDTFASIPGRITVINGADYSVITTLDVGGAPRGMAVDKAADKIYVANVNTNSVMVINGSDNSVTTLATTDRPIAAAWNANTGLLYVANNVNDGGYGAITVYNSTGSVVDTVSVDKYPSAIAVNTSTNAIYVAHETSPVSTVTLIDGSDNTVVDTMDVGAYPESIAVNESTNKIYVANSWSDSVSVIDGASNTVAQTVSVGSNPWGVAVNKNTNKIYVANQAGQSVSVIDGATNTVVQTLGISGNGGAIAVVVDQTRNKIYVPSLNTNDLTVIDGSVIDAASVTGLTAPSAGAVPQATGALTPGGGRYTVTGLNWENLDGSPATLNSGDFANAGNTYKAEIELTAGSDYKFPAAGLTPTVNAGIPTAGSVSGGDVLGNKLTFEVTFPANITTTSLGSLTAPASGATPAGVPDLVSGNPAQYSVTSLAWEDTGGNLAVFDSNGKFQYGGSWYRARIVLTSQPGYKFPAGGLTPDIDGDGTATAGTVGGGAVSGNTLTFLVTFSDDIYDYQAYISGLNPPAPGETPQVAGDLDVYNSGQYCTVSGLTWKNSDGSPATLSGGKFITGGSTYRVAIELTAQPGYKFPPSGFTPTVDYDGTFVSGTVSGGYVSGNKFTFVISFSNDITTTSVAGLVAPVKGAAPITYNDLTAGNTTQYDVDYLEWVNSDDSPASLTGGKFNASSTYKAMIYLESKAGYKFPANGLAPTINIGTLGAVAVSGGYTSDNSLVFEVIFPATASDTTDTGSSTGGGGGGTPQEPQKPDGGISGNTYTATTTVTAKTDSSGKTTASVTKTQVNDAINKAVAEADKQGTGMKAVVEIKVETTNSSNVNSVETSIPKDAVGMAVNGGADELKVSTPVASLSFDTSALTTIFGEAAGDVNITASKVDPASLPEGTKQIVGDRPVFNFSVISGNQTISQFGGNVTASVPYTPKPGEDPNSIVVYYINSQGQPEMVSNCAYDPATGTVSFTTDHFSQYAVGYNEVAFKDVSEKAWYSDAVGFAAARGIVTGTGNGNFDPTGKLTRGQLLVMLMRAYGIEPDTDLSINFSDAGNTYFTGYLAAAKRLGITEGIGNNLYAPNAKITRQEMFTLLYNTLKQMDALPAGTGGFAAEYSDADSVAAWAKEAANTLTAADIVSGSGGKLSPKNTTSRAEMAQVIYNLLSK